MPRRASLAPSSTITASVPSGTDQSRRPRPPEAVSPDTPALAISAAMPLALSARASLAGKAACTGKPVAGAQRIAQNDDFDRLIGRAGRIAGVKTQAIVTHIASKLLDPGQIFPHMTGNRERWSTMKAPTQPAPAIALAGVNLSLGQGAARVHILKDIDLNIGSGEAIGLIGPSGSGKSTLLMVMAGLERADTGTVMVAGENLGDLDEDELARFRGRNVGIVFQSFHLIPTMTALENVAVPLELAGVADAQERARAELDRRRPWPTPASLSGAIVRRRAAARRGRARAGAQSGDPGRRRADRQSRRGHRPADRRSAVRRPRKARRHAGAGDARSSAGAALRPRRALALRPYRGRSMSAAESRNPDRWLPLRFALREMRGGLRGFYVFIACIALGSMAIAGVGSLAASLADGLAREGQVILGGDLAFSLIQREAKAGRTRLPQRQRQGLERRHLARHGAHAGRRGDAGRTQSRRQSLSAVRRGHARTGAAARPRPWPNATASMAPPPTPTLMARLAIKPGARVTVGNATFEIRAALTNEPDKLAGGIGFGPRLLISEDALRATGLMQPGSLVRWRYRVRLPASGDSDAAAQAVDDAGAQAIAASRLGHPQPQQCLAAACSATSSASRNSSPSSA